MEPDSTVHFSPIRGSYLVCKYIIFSRGIMIISHLYDVALIICIMLRAATTTESSCTFCSSIIVQNHRDSVDVAQVG